MIKTELIQEIDNENYLKDKLRRFLNDFSITDENKIEPKLSFKGFIEKDFGKNEYDCLHLKNGIYNIRYQAKTWDLYFILYFERDIYSENNIEIFDSLTKNQRISNNHQYLFIPQFKRNNKILGVFARSTLITPKA